MARISKTDHPRILHLVDIDRRKVVDVAIEYGCTPANIYALLGKMRRARADEGATESGAARTAGATPPPGDQPQRSVAVTSIPSKSAGPADLFIEAVPEMTAPPSYLIDHTADLRAPAAVTQAAASSHAPASAAAVATSPGSSDRLDLALNESPTARPVWLALVEALPQKGASAVRAGAGSMLAEAGFGLSMRTADGDETVTPFRSLDDLLSVIKPVLRSAARSPDAVWFSIQPIDLSTLEVDAA